jgi:hypothetical protein
VFCLLQVGRIDHAEANPENSLLPGEATLTEMDSYWTARGMTMEEGVALLGIHALMEVRDLFCWLRLCAVLAVVPVYETRAAGQDRQCAAWLWRKGLHCLACVLVDVHGVCC